MTPSVLPAYGLKEESLKLEAFGSGLINNTWKVITPEKEYILQRVNHNVFKEPGDIANNISLIAEYLKQHHPEYKFVAPITSSNGEGMIYQKGEGFFRMFPFVSGSHSKDVVETPEQACEAATQFGRFTRLLSGFDISQLKITIPFFHDLTLRYQQFLTALENGNKQRISESDVLIKKLAIHADIVSDFGRIKSGTAFKLRVTHHDTKISNVLFDAEGKGLCVIDLDTVMPGYFISDVGDMMRTYLSPVSEEEKDFSRIKVRDEFYKAIVKGYFTEMKDELTETEKNNFFYAGKFMIYMQAIRFLTDHFNNDEYYGAKYPGHNLVRAGNQAVLLQRLLEKEAVLSDFRE
jgi:Ser/Thr protein kinase RdoA (MazF antagonist)